MTIQNTQYLESISPADCIFTLLLEKRAAESPDKIFFTFGDDRYSFGEFNEKSNSMARRLMDEGVTQGGVVAVLMSTSPEYLTLWFALGKLGAVEVPINTAYHGEILLHQLRTSGATSCVIDEAYLKSIKPIIDKSSIKQCYINGNVGDSTSSIYKDFSELLVQGSGQNESANLGIDISHADTGGIIFTSGTTGPSKGVLLSYRYLTAYGLMYADVNSLRDDDVIMNFLPFFHMSGKFLTIATLVCGGSMRLIPRLSISGFMGEVRDYGVTNFVGVGGICNMLLSTASMPADADSTIRTIYAVPDPDVTHHELEQRFNCSITTVFGSTEVGLPLYRGVNDGYRAGSCGRMSPNYDVKIVDKYDNEVLVGEIGEIVIRSNKPYLLASGYVGVPEKTVETWRNLWFHSGDNGRVDDDGWFYFEDRASDSIRRRGENISSFEVEMLVGKHESVSEVAAVSYPSELGEDEVRIFVIARSGQALTAEELFIHCGEHMPYFMVPRYIDIVDDFPRTPTAKIEKYKLRKEAKSATTWDYLDHGWTLNRSGISK